MPRGRVGEFGIHEQLDVAGMGTNSFFRVNSVLLGGSADHAQVVRAITKALREQQLGIIDTYEGHEGFITAVRSLRRDRKKPSARRPARSGSFWVVSTPILEFAKNCTAFF